MPLLEPYIMLSYTCAACGKSITDAALQQGTAVREGSRLFCASCAALIVTPDTLPAVPDQPTEPASKLEVLAEFKISIHAPDVLSPFAVPQHEGINSKDVVAADVELLEGVNQDMAHAHDDDEWFKPRSSGVATADGSAPRLKPASPAPAIVSAPAPAPVAAAPSKSAHKPGSKPNLMPAKPAAKSSGISNRVGTPAAAPAPRKSAAPSARMAAVAPPQPEVESEPEVVAPPPVQARKSGRSSAIKPAAATPARGGSSRRISAVRAPESAPVEEAADKSAVEQDSEDVAVASPSKGKSSRRMLAAKGSARSSASRSRRDEREEKDSRKDKDKKGKGKGDDKMPLYIGIGVVAVLLLGAFVVMGRNKDEGDTAKKPIPEEFDKTPSGTYARDAEKALSAGTRSKAVELYNKAAAQAEREGNTAQARNYGMKAMNLIKSSKLSDH